MSKTTLNDIFSPLMKDAEERRDGLEKEILDLKNQKDKTSKAGNKELDLERKNLESISQAKIQELNKRESKISNREKQVSKKESEFEGFQEQIASHNKNVLEFINEKKEVKRTKESYLEKEHRAGLIIKQYEKKIEELNK